MITKKIMSLFLSIVMIITLFTCKTNTVLANNRSYNSAMDVINQDNLRIQLYFINFH